MMYLMKSSACLALFYIVYLALFRNTDRFQLNRAYLLAGLVLSFVLPAVVLPATSIDVVLVPSLITDLSTEVAVSEAVPGATTSVTLSSVVQFIYGTGVVISFAILIYSIFRIVRLYWLSEKFNYCGRSIAVTPNSPAFSFFGWVFLRYADDDHAIIEHELVHVRQYHWIDLLLVEIATALLWFNPLIYFYKKSIAIQHEYIADRSVLSSIPVKEYLHCIVRQLETNFQAALSSHFRTQSIKQRIKMMTNTKSYSPIRYVIILPLVVVLLAAFTDRGAPDQNQEFRSPVDVSKLRKEPGPGFGARVNPSNNKEQVHTGVDLVAPAGTAVYATANGVVAKTSVAGNRGKFILINHDNKLASSYSHLEQISVKEGERVNQGQLIGLVGSTGVSTGPHLHFEILKEGKAVDPVPYLNMK